MEWASAAVAAPSFQADIATWAMPLDLYVPDGDLQQYAARILVARCLEPHGIRWPVYNPRDYNPPYLNRVDRSVFDVALASEYGYHPGRPRKGSLPEDPPLTAEQDDQVKRCGSAASRERGVDTQLRNSVETLMAMAYASAKASAPVKSAISRWSRCMAPLRLTDLPSAPFQMPTPSQRARFLPKSKSAAQNAATPPTRAELHEATFDADCRVRSGYLQTIYSQEIAFNEAAIAAHADLAKRAFDSASRADDASRATVRGYEG